MKNLSLLATSLTVALAVNVNAADQKRDQTQTRDPSSHTTQQQAQESEKVYGSELMSKMERMQYQFKMRSLDTEQEREAFRAEHHKKMQERARAQGKVLPDMIHKGAVPGQGKGQGPAVPPQAQERAYGSELMTDKERKEYQERIRSLKTDQEREAFRVEHHKKMQERAKAQGMTLPDMPQERSGPATPPWMSQGQGKGQGAGKP